MAQQDGPQRFRKRPVIIEAMQFTGDNLEAIAAFIGETPPHEAIDAGMYVIKTLEGDMAAFPYDWIIKGVQGEFYPCKADIFAETYEPVTDGV